MGERVPPAARDRGGQSTYPHSARLAERAHVGPHRVGRGHEAAQHQHRGITSGEPERRHHPHARRSLEGLAPDHDLVLVVEPSARLYPPLVQLLGGPVRAGAQLTRGLGARGRRGAVGRPAFLQPAQLPEAKADEYRGDQEKCKEREPAGEG